MYLSPLQSRFNNKQQSIVCVFQYEPNLRKSVRSLSISKQMVVSSFKKYWTCRNRTITKMQNSQFWVVHNYFLPNSQENQPLQITLHHDSHIGSNNCIFEHPKHLMSLAIYSWLGTEIILLIAVRKNQTIKSSFFYTLRSGWCIQNAW